MYIIIIFIMYYYYVLLFQYSSNGFQWFFRWLDNWTARANYNKASTYPNMMF